MLSSGAAHKQSAGMSASREGSSARRMSILKSDDIQNVSYTRCHPPLHFFPPHANTRFSLHKVNLTLAFWRPFCPPYAKTRFSLSCVTLICHPHMSPSYVTLICHPHMSPSYVTLIYICHPHMSPSYVTLICHTPIFSLTHTSPDSSQFRLNPHIQAIERLAPIPSHTLTSPTHLPHTSPTHISRFVPKGSHRAARADARRHLQRQAGHPLRRADPESRVALAPATTTQIASEPKPSTCTPPKSSETYGAPTRDSASTESAAVHPSSSTASLASLAPSAPLAASTTVAFAGDTPASIGASAAARAARAARAPRCARYFYRALAPYRGSGAERAARAKIATSAHARAS